MSFNPNDFLLPKGPKMDSLKGYKTIIAGALMAGVPAVLTYLGGVDWSQYVSPTMAMMISGAVTIILRAVTTGPIGSKT